MNLFDNYSLDHSIQSGMEMFKCFNYFCSHLKIRRYLNQSCCGTQWPFDRRARIPLRDYEVWFWRCRWPGKLDARCTSQSCIWCISSRCAVLCAVRIDTRTPIAPGTVLCVGCEWMTAFPSWPMDRMEYTTCWTDLDRLSYSVWDCL